MIAGIVDRLRHRRQAGSGFRAIIPISSTYCRECDTARGTLLMLRIKKSESFAFRVMAFLTDEQSHLRRRDASAKC
jgi:hypothetical protein